MFSSCFTTHRKVHKKGIKKRVGSNVWYIFFLFSLPSFLFLFYSSILKISTLRSQRRLKRTRRISLKINFARVFFLCIFPLSSFFFFKFIERKEKHVEVERLKITVDGTPLFSELSLLRLIIVFTTWIQKNLLPLFSPDSRFNRLTGIEFLSKDKIYRPTLGIHPPSFLSFLEPIES